MSRSMSHPSTIKHISNLSALTDISPQFAALHLSKYRLLFQDASTTSPSCAKCGSLVSTRIHRIYKRRVLIHNCSHCAFIRKTSIPSQALSPSSKSIKLQDNPTVTLSPTENNQNSQAPQQQLESIRTANKKKTSSLQQLLARNRVQKEQPIDLGLAAFLQQF